MQTLATQQIQPLELESITNHDAQQRRRSDPAQWVTERGGSFIPLELETRPTVDTAAYAHYMHIAQQTARIHACRETGPIRPIRIPGLAKLQWPTAEIRRVLGVA